MRFPQANSRAAAILINELEAGRFQSPANGQIIGCRHGRLAIDQLGAADRSDAKSGLSREIFCTPPEQSAGETRSCAPQVDPGNIVAQYL